MDESYWIKAKWGARPETPEALADRFLRTVDAIRALHPLLDTWRWGDVPEIKESEGERGIYPFSTVRGDLATAIERNMGDGDDGEPDPYYGYLMIIRSDQTSPDSEVGLSISAGDAIPEGTLATSLWQYASFEIGPKPEPSLITFDFLRAVLLILAETWEATVAEASPGDITPYRLANEVWVSWMKYICPRFASRVTPPPSAIVEWRPNGGLLLAATRDTFETANQNHIAVARDIEAALRGLRLDAAPVR